MILLQVNTTSVWYCKHYLSMILLQVNTTSVWHCYSSAWRQMKTGLTVKVKNGIGIISLQFRLSASLIFYPWNHMVRICWLCLDGLSASDSVQELSTAALYGTLHGGLYGGSLRRSLRTLDRHWSRGDCLFSKCSISFTWSTSQTLGCVCVCVRVCVWSTSQTQGCARKATEQSTAVWAHRRETPKNRT